MVGGGGYLQQRGQVAVLYALLFPILLLCGGVGLDLGWYYLNVSRLQNAADAAALAGAREIAIASNNIYFTKGLKENKLPGEKIEYTKIFTSGFGSLPNYEEKLSGLDDAAFAKSRITAENYVRKNLGDERKPTGTEQKELIAIDSYSVSKADEDKQVKGTVTLYAERILDVKDDKLVPMYYVVELNEKIRHFFLPGWFNDMDAPVRAVVALLPHDTDLMTKVQILEKKNVIGNWEYQTYYKDRDGVYQGDWQQIQDSKIHYTNGNTYRTEKVTVKGSNNKDSLNIDFRWDTQKKSTANTQDWDLLPASEVINYGYQDGWSKYLANQYRIRFNADFNTPYNTRHPKDPTPDVLWIRIESDPINNLSYIGKDENKHYSYNSVRQITININQANTAKYTDAESNKGVPGSYKYRPLFIFYDGPENLDFALDEKGNQIRRAQPFVVNLNADFNGIIFVPESPAIIRGNGHTWNGFIIARSFVVAVTEDDLTKGNYFERNDGYGNTEKVKGDYVKTSDSYGNTIFIKWTNTISKSEIDGLGGAFINAEDSKGNIIRFASDKLLAKVKSLNDNKDAYAINSEIKDASTGNKNEIKLILDNSPKKYATELVDTKSDTNNIEVYYNDSIKYTSSLTDEQTATNATEVKEIKYIDKNKVMTPSTDVNNDNYTLNFLEVTIDGKTYYVHRKDIEIIFRKVTSGSDTGYFVEASGDYIKNYQEYVPNYDLDYYQKVEQIADDKNEKGTKIGTNDNSVIVDRTGNILTKSLPPDSYETNPYIPLDNDWEKIVDGNPYRIKSEEIVYHREAFNLSTDSYYNAFEIPSLKRVVYTYLDNYLDPAKENSPDMFFTTTRSSWID